MNTRQALDPTVRLNRTFRKNTKRQLSNLAAECIRTGKVAEGLMATALLRGLERCGANHPRFMGLIKKAEENT